MNLSVELLYAVRIFDDHDFAPQIGAMHDSDLSRAAYDWDVNLVEDILEEVAQRYGLTIEYAYWSDYYTGRYLCARSIGGGDLEVVLNPNELFVNEEPGNAIRSALADLGIASYPEPTWLAVASYG